MSIELQTYHDCVQPFLIHHSNVRGKLVRLNEVVNTILGRHNYPECISKLLGEMLVVATILSGNLKGRGVLTVQLKAEGALRFMVVDATADGELRGYADIAEGADHEALESLSFSELVGKGYLAITLHKGKEPYQGIVQLTGDSLIDSVQEYFTNSEQQGIWLKVMVDTLLHSDDRREWFAGGIMLQHMPEEGGKAKEYTQLSDDPEELWSRAITLAETLKKEELFDISLSPQALLYRLYNEDGVWVHDAFDVTVGCRCSREKVADVLSNFPKEEVESMMEDDELVVNCQFCNQAERFSVDDVEGLFKNASAG